MKHRGMGVENIATFRVGDPAIAQNLPVLSPVGPPGRPAGLGRPLDHVEL